MIWDVQISATKPISEAFARMKLVLFQPFELGKWFTLGFCSFLAQCGRGGGGNFNLPSGGGGGGSSSGPAPVPPAGHGGTALPGVPGGTGSTTGGPVSGGGGTGSSPGAFYDEIMQWLQGLDWAVVGFAVGFAVVLFVGMVLLMLWLGARGSFMFLDGVVHNRAAVVEPWGRFRRPAWSVFRFRVMMHVVGLVWMLLCAGVGIAIAWPDISSQQSGTASVVALSVGISLAAAGGLCLILVDVVLHDFVIPIMYVRSVGAAAGFGLFRRELLRGHVSSVFLFYVMRVVLGVAMWFMTVMAVCLTCCMAALPYLSSVVLLPLAVFSRSYSLYFMQQYGDAWRVFPEHVCLGCGYDLRGSVGQGTCPECGAPIPVGEAVAVEEGPPMPPPGRPY